MPITGRLLPLLCAVLLFASPLGAQNERPPKSSSTLITADEVQKSGVGNAFEAVQRLRPRWLRPREVLRLPNTAGNEMGDDLQMQQIRVYIDDYDRGDVEFLRTIPAELIYTLRYMSMNEAGARFGPAAGPGIVVTLKH